MPTTTDNSFPYALKPKAGGSVGGGGPVPYPTSGLPYPSVSSNAVKPGSIPVPVPGYNTNYVCIHYTNRLYHYHYQYPVH